MAENGRPGNLVSYPAMSMIRLPRALAAWNSPDFDATLKDELQGLGPGALPLQQGLSGSSRVLDDPCQVMVIRVEDEPARLRARVGVFYAGITAGCSCADDPTPVEAQAEYCELLVLIDKASGEAAVSLAADTD